jgi:predicted small lipoprotein YifL
MRWLVLLVLSLNVAMCGQKGPLTLPDEAPAVATMADTGPTRK